MPVINLPRSSLLYMDNDRIEINIPENYLKNINYANIHCSKGILKDKNIDPLEYQKKVRDEWD